VDSHQKLSIIPIVIAAVFWFGIRPDIPIFSEEKHMAKESKGINLL
jgi:hypothetical protein